MALIQKLAQENLFKKATVAVVGDVMLDTFVYGNVERISPEAPVPVVHVTHNLNTLGGAGNVAANIADLGATPLLIGCVGQDAAQEKLFEMAGSQGFSTDYLVKTNLPTIRKTRIVSGGQQIVRIDEEELACLVDENRNALIQKMEQARTKADVVIVADYGKGVVDQQMFEDIKRIWAGGTVLVDPKVHKHMVDYTGASCMTPNLMEAKELAEVQFAAKTDDDAERIARDLVAKFQMESVLCTRSGDGMTLLEGEQVHHYKSFEHHEVRDVSGAGDTVIAVLGTGIASGFNMKETVELCNISGSIVVSKIGTATIHWQEIADALHRSGKAAA